MYLTPYYDRGLTLDPIPVTSEIHVPSDEHNDLFYPDENCEPQKIIGDVILVNINGVIVGNGVHNFIHPLLNENGNIFVIRDDVKRVINPEEAEGYGVFRIYYVPTRRRRRYN